MATLDEAKSRALGKPRWKLKRGYVYQSPDGFTYVAYLDPPVAPASDRPMESEESTAIRDDLDQSIEAHPERTQRQIDYLTEQFGGRKVKLLDVGCGGGAFLVAALAQGHEASGLEVDPILANYCRSLGLAVEAADVSSPDFRTANAGSYDAVTLWDVIEHVNYPHQTLASVFEIVKPGGIVFIDTPAKDSFYHRAGELTYALTGGRVPGFLNIMYSDEPFGHKQILSTDELRRMLQSVGFVDVKIRRLHELSMPYFAYIRNMTGSAIMGRLLAPIAALFFKMVRIRNKMIVTARRPS